MNPGLDHFPSSLCRSAGSLRTTGGGAERGRRRQGKDKMRRRNRRTDWWTREGQEAAPEAALMINGRLPSATSAAICPASACPCLVTRSSRPDCPHTHQPHVVEPARCSCAQRKEAWSVCSQSMQGLSNSHSTEYLRKKFFFFLRERKGGGRSHRGRGREGGKEKPTPSLQSRSQAWV